MSYEPHTERIGPDEQCELPRSAVGVTVDRDGDTYIVHYLALTETAREERREKVRDTLDQLPESECEVGSEKRRELSLPYSSSDTLEPSQ